MKQSHLIFLLMLWCCNMWTARIVFSENLCPQTLHSKIFQRNRWRRDLFWFPFSWYGFSTTSSQRFQWLFLYWQYNFHNLKFFFSFLCFLNFCWKWENMNDYESDKSVKTWVWNTGKERVKRGVKKRVKRGVKSG